MALIEHIVIVGGGFTGISLAVNLLQMGDARVTLIDRSEVAGLGVAYATTKPHHVLNVPAARMSALADDHDHFVRWLAQSGEAAGAQDFAPRATYGRYLRALLGDALVRWPDRLRIVAGDAVDVDDSGSPRVVLADGTRIAADAVVLALGNLAPGVPGGLVAIADDARYLADPWQAGALDGITGRDTVLLVGTGLTMVDVALTLSARADRPRIIALSRRGLVPRPHIAAANASTPPPPAPLAAAPDGPLSQRLRSVRRRAAAIGWRAAIDELRPFTQAAWGGLSAGERRRFLRHLRPWWDVHRHRLAPTVGERFADLIATGAVRIVAGRIDTASSQAQDIAVRWQPRGSAAVETLCVEHVVNCTGPRDDLRSTREPLLAQLAKRGVLSGDADHLGVASDAAGRTLRSDGGINRTLYAVGPITRGRFWEIVAVPDLRQQTAALARRLYE